MSTYSYTAEPASQFSTGLLIVPVFQGPKPGPGVDRLNLAEAYAAARLSGKRGEDLLVPRRPGDGFAADAVMLVGVGPKDAFTVDVARRALGRVAGTARRFGAVATTFAQAFGARDAAEAVAAAAEGLGLGAYRFDRFRTKDGDAATLKKVTVLGAARWDAKVMRAAAKDAAGLVEAVSWARDLVNTPAGDMPPATIAKQAQAMAREVGLSCKVWAVPQLKQGGFGGILGVGQGSANPPRMIELRYTGAGRATPLALTGKGIAFDSGGLSIKDAKGMESMKDDMAGAASILATMRVIAQRKPKLNVIAVIPCAENMPSGTAQRPGDVIVHRGGTTSEVLNTDAEGRLVLADALAYLIEQEPQLVIDTATLTGACVVALGDKISGAFSNDDDLVARVIAAGEAVGEPVWRLPLFGEYRRLIDSDVADIKNIGERYGGAIAAAWFLATFVGDTPWVHMDIAGPAFAPGGTDLGPKGATGVPVRTLVRFLENWAAVPAAKAGRRSR